MGRRWVAYLVTAVALAAVALPGFTDRDSFPLSNYPMFSWNRGQVASFDTAVGVEADGTIERLSPRRISGSYEVIHAASTVTKAIRSGDTDALCREIAARAADDGFAHIEVVTETYDTIRWFEGDQTPLRRTVHARCEAPA